MKVIIRIEIDDKTRNRLAKLNTPNTPARLATRKEVAEIALGAVAALAELETFLEENPIRPPCSNTFAPDPGAINRPRVRPTLNALIARARQEDAAALAGKSDGFVIGWCKVKFSKELKA